MIAFIDDHGGVFGVGPICRVLGIAPSTFYAHKAVERDPDRASARAKRDLSDKDAIKRVFSQDENAKIMLGDLKYLQQQQTPTEDGRNGDIQSEHSDDDESEMSHQNEAHDEHNINATTTTLTAFDDYDSKSMGQQMFHQSYLGQEVDPETEAREEYMRKLMSFRKDELVLADESDDFDEVEENEGSKP